MKFHKISGKMFIELGLYKHNFDERSYSWNTTYFILLWFEQKSNWLKDIWLFEK